MTLSQYLAAIRVRRWTPEQTARAHAALRVAFLRLTRDEHFLAIDQVGQA